MAIVQDAYDIPDEILQGILKGIYKRFGSVVRYNVGPKRGQIVKHLDPIDLPAADSKGMLAKMATYATKHPKTVIGVGVGAAAAVGLGIYFVIRSKKEPVEIVRYRDSLKAYIHAIRKGKLTLEIIEEMISAMDALKTRPDYEEISIALSSEELDILVSRLCEYTRKLAMDNQVDLSPAEEEAPQLDKHSIIDFRRYLEAQKRIFHSAA